MQEPTRTFSVTSTGLLEEMFFLQTLSVPFALRLAGTKADSTSESLYKKKKSLYKKSLYKKVQEKPVHLAFSARCMAGFSSPLLLNLFTQRDSLT